MNSINMSYLPCKLYSIFLIFIFLSGCQLGEKQYLEIIDLKSGILNTKKELLSSFVQSIDYIQLEETEESKILEVSALVSDDSVFFILDRRFRKILSFDYHGHYLKNFCIDSKRILEPRELQIDKSNKIISVFDAAVNKIIQFDYYGKFLRMINKENLSHIFTTCNGKIYTYNTIVSLPNNNYYHIFEIDLANNQSHYYHRNCAYIRKSFVSSGHAVQYIFMDTLTYWNSPCDTIYRFCKSKNIPRYVFSYGDLKVPIENYSQGGINSKFFSDFLNVINFIETKNNIFITVTYHKILFYLIYDKNTKRIVNTSNVSKKSIRCFGMLNDLSFSLPFWPINSLDDDKVYCLETIKRLQDYNLAFGCDSAKTYQSKILIDKFITSGNPILIITKMK